MISAPHLPPLPVSRTVLQAIATKYGTPVYVYHAGMIRDAYRAYETALRSTLPRDTFTICYAAKANSHGAILALLARLGSGADIVSGGELQRALAAGIPPEKIVFSGVGKSRAEISDAIRLGIGRINVESAAELADIAAIAKKLKKTARVALRVNPDVDAKTHAKITTGRSENKFGIDIPEAEKLYRAALKMPYVDATGVAVHIGSQLLSLRPFDKAYGRVADLVNRLKSRGIVLTHVDAGGGIGIVYNTETAPDLAAYARIVAKHFGGQGLHVTIEPGRSIVASAGMLLTRVRHIKQGTVRHFMILDAGMNDLLRPALYDAYHAIVPVAARRGTARLETYDVVGPVCETGDTFATARRLPVMREGDLAAILCAGAYGASMGSTYNSRLLAAEVLVDGARMALISERQTIDDLVARERLPAWF